MDGLLAFLGNIRDFAWIYLCAMFLAATGLFFFDRAPKESARRDEIQTHESKAA